MDFISLQETTSRTSDVLVDEIFTVTDIATKMVVLMPCSSRWKAAEVGYNFWWEVVRTGVCVRVLDGADEVFGY